MSEDTEIQELILELRQSFLAELPDRLDEMEKNLMALEKGEGDFKEIFNAFYRGVHSLKGIGGTFGLHVITSICHHLEDVINQAKTSPERFNRAFVDNCLRYIDLIKLVGVEAGKGADSFQAIEDKLSHLRNQHFSRKLTALVVVNAKLTRSMCSKLLQEHDVRQIDENDGLSALHRALTQPIDLILASSELPLLSGEALIAALRLSTSVNRHAKIILISSSSSPTAPHKRSIDADILLPRNSKFIANLDAVIKQIINGSK
ncbi:MAG: Hpt domain-containing protein [Sulfuricellaceae bacterium]|nr:Hpt domain-containing protein [Sulfuricellaceae bacterium]